MTLLRGPQKALFPMVGDHRVNLTATWQRNGAAVCLKSSATVRVTATVDDNHRAAALKVHSTPDTLFSLAIIGDHLTEGNATIEAAVANPILKPHFAIIRAKLLLTGPNSPKPEEACALIDDEVVMSFEEIDSVSQLLCKRYPPKSGSDPLKKVVACLLRKIDLLRADGSIEDRPAAMVRQRLKSL